MPSDLHKGAAVSQAFQALGKGLLIAHPDSGAAKALDDAEQRSIAIVADEKRKEAEKKAAKKAKKGKIAGIFGKAAGTAANFIPVVGPMVSPLVEQGVTAAAGGDFDASKIVPGPSALPMKSTPMPDNVFGDTGGQLELKGPDSVFGPPMPTPAPAPNPAAAGTFPQTDGKLVLKGKLEEEQKRANNAILALQ